MKELINIQSELVAPKNQRNNFGKYNYRSAEDILEAVKPLLKQYNCTLLISDDIILVGDRFYIKATATIENSDKESKSVTAYAREALSKKGMDESQITGASSSYARKYALNGLFLIDDTKDADATNNHGYNTQQSKAPTPKPKAPRSKIELVKDSEDWKNVMGAISDGKVLDISRFERRFNISKELKNELLQEIEVAKMANEHAETKSADNSKHLTDALAEVNACSEIQKLNDLWSKHTELHTNKVFIGAVTARKKQLVKPKK